MEGSGTTSKRSLAPQVLGLLSPGCLAAVDIELLTVAARDKTFLADA